jgi:ferredoxin
MRILDSRVKRQTWIKYYRDLCVGCGAYGFGCPNGAFTWNLYLKRNGFKCLPVFLDGKRHELRIWEWRNRKI